MDKRACFGEKMVEIEKNQGFLFQRSFWSTPVVGILANNSLSGELLKKALDGPLKECEADDVIGILSDWETVAEGIFFTVDAIYVNTPKNREREFKVRYKDIDEIKTESGMLIIKLKNSKVYRIDTKLWSKTSIAEYLRFVITVDEEESTDIDFDFDNAAQITESTGMSGSETAGIIYADVSNAATNYHGEKFGTPRGHGFAAEQMNHLNDKLSFKDAVLVGDDIDPTTGKIVKNGADRVVDGVRIQTKFCSTGGKCVSECFENGRFRYINPDGSPMQIEVPRDMYDSALQAMKSRIEKGEVPGVTDVKEAENIIRKSPFTYDQAKNVAKAGTVESIIFDAVNGMVIATTSFGITSAMAFATSIWNGEDFDIALKNSVASGLKVGSTALITQVIAGQLAKAGLNSALVGSSEQIINIMGPKASALIANSLRGSGTSIYGAAAMKSAAKILRTNAITGAASVVVLSSVDVVNIFSGKISGTQLFKNVTNTAATVAAGGAGWVAGAAIGSVVPFVGSVVGGLIGSMVAGSKASKLTKKVMDNFIEDDAERMVSVIQSVFEEMAEEYLINKEEAERITDKLQTALDGKTIKEMFASPSHREFARNLMEGMFEEEAKNRPHVSMPSNESFIEKLRTILEECADEMEELSPA